MEITISLQGITSDNIYKYTSLIMAALSFVPQIKLSYKRAAPMNDISYTSLCMQIFSGLLWTLYMYENASYAYSVCTFFITSNVITIFSMKIYYYVKDVREIYNNNTDLPATDPTATAMVSMVHAANQIAQQKNEV